MNKCHNCGMEVDENKRFCNYCGANLDKTAEEDKNNDVYICPVCGAENEPGVNKCMYCCSIAVK